MKHRILTLFFLIVTGLIGYSQSDTELKQRAKEFFAINRYEDALATLQSSRNLVRNDKEGKFLIALCQYQLNHLDQASEILTGLVANEKEPYPECWFYLGKIFHARHQFVEASKYYKIYLKNIPANNPNRDLIVDMVRRCANGQQYQYRTSTTYVENLGRQVNTNDDEFGPVLSPNYSDRLYFTSARSGSMGGKRNRQGTPDERAGQFFYDMYVSSITNGAWGNVQPMPYQLNSPRHEQLLDFNKDGSALIYFKGMAMDRGDMIVDTFRQMEARILSSDPFISPINTQDGDCCPFFYNDTLIIFASRRPGGYGGSDLYRISYKNGRWTIPQNLGSDINTPYDETTPFLARDGKTLYFSSNYPEWSIGGQDIFRTEFVPSINRWIDPQNIGMPINSAADDAYFRLANDGFTGFFSSARKDGLGQRDLYIAYFNSYLEEMELPAMAYQSPPVRETQPSQPNIPPNQRTQPPVVEETLDEHPFVEEENMNRTAETRSDALFFNNISEINNAANQAVLNNIAQQLLNDRGRTLVITSYAITQNAEKLAQAIKSAEAAARYFTNQGIAESAIFMRAAFAQNNASGQEKSFATIFNISGSETLAAKGSEMLYDELLEQDLVYKVQIASSQRGDYDGDLLTRFDHAMVEKTLDFAYYRYTVGAVSTYAEALRLQEQAKQSVPSAYIAAYVYGRRVERKDAGRYVTQLPDLRNYAR